MNFDHRHTAEEPELNFIPLIDVLLVILIFLAAASTFTQRRALDVSLPQARALTPDDRDQALHLAISRDGRMALDGQYIENNAIEALTQSLQHASGAAGAAPALYIEADALATHEAVVRALEAARQAQIARIRFVTQSGP